MTGTLLGVALALAGEPALPDETVAAPPERTPASFQFTPTLSLAATTRNLSLGGLARWGEPTGFFASGSFGTDWLLSGLVSGFLLDDIASLRLTASQSFGYTFARPREHLLPRPAPWLPRVSVAVGLWEAAELDSLLQTFRTEDYGLYLSAATGGQVSLSFRFVSVALALKPFAGAAYLRNDAWVNNQFQFTNTVLDVDLTLDLRVFSRRVREAPP